MRSLYEPSSSSNPKQERPGANESMCSPATGLYKTSPEFSQILIYSTQEDLDRQMEATFNPTVDPSFTRPEQSRGTSSKKDQKQIARNSKSPTIFERKLTSKCSSQDNVMLSPRVTLATVFKDSAKSHNLRTQDNKRAQNAIKEFSPKEKASDRKPTLNSIEVKPILAQTVTSESPPRNFFKSNLFKKLSNVANLPASNLSSGLAEPKIGSRTRNVVCTSDCTLNMSPNLTHGTVGSSASLT